MPASFTRLRIAGFKSFAEAATIEVLPGLTGIVGPNGCGKSNVVEALRWAMGETSARSLRGEDMDDVIFAGTADRPSRNLADVTLVLEETRNLAPPPFDGFDQLEISRRIERGNGSAYRINGREARARDVQTLFADLASGARASAMVSQGRVGALVAARPEERRSILEEAAGITGLHARRHEAELKLRQAEANLSRSEDMRGQLEAQLEALRRQSRQAARYRSVSASIRNAEAELLSLQHARAEAARRAAAAAHQQATALVTEAASATVAAAAQADQAMLRVPGLREAEAQARTALERHRLAGEQIEAEIERARQALAACIAQQDRLRADLAHADQQEQQARDATARLQAEAATLALEAEAHPALEEAARHEALLAADAMRACDEAANRATEHAAALTARHTALADAIAVARKRVQRLTEQSRALAQEQAELEGAGLAPERLAEAQRTASEAEAALAAASLALQQAETARATATAEAATLRQTAQREAAAARAAASAQSEAARATAQAALAAARQSAQRTAEAARSDAVARLTAAREAASSAALAVRQAEATRLEQARAAHQSADAIRARIQAEHTALAEVLGLADGEKWPRLIDQLTVPPGLEDALGAALGEELAAAADPDAARHWRDQPEIPLPTLPAAAQPLSDLVQAPALLARALSQIGLVTQATPALLAALAPGQTLLSAEGGVWRWDGYTIRPGTSSPAALRLQQRNRLKTLAQELAQAEAAASAAAATLRATEQAHAEALAQAAQTEQAALAAADAQARQTIADAVATETAQREAAEAVAQQAIRQAEQAEAEIRTRTASQETQAATQAAALEAASQDAERQARAARSQHEATARIARAEAVRLEQRLTEIAARSAGLEAQRSRLTQELQDATQALTQAEAQAATLGDPAAARTALDAARTALAKARQHERDSAAAHEALLRAESTRQARLRVLHPEQALVAERLRDAGFRRTDLLARMAQAEAERQRLEQAPAALLAQSERAGVLLAEAVAVHEAAAHRLAEADAAAQNATNTARRAEQALAFARETAVRAEGEVHQANAAWGVVAERILERLGSSHDLPPPPTDVSSEAEERFRRRHEKLLREREEMGPVNLRAEIEANAMEEQIATLAREREEIATAIAKLRGSVGHLNREGRDRLTTVFAQVDAQFQALFTRMFGGGRAHLALVGSDDPLTAGLEIYAQPPGKKLAALSLLSGGEQALTALSLIFAVFRCNPAPICVLDEVDAPLDDANVARFCALLEDMVGETGTRFLVVTHHALTMARMDRLYGVTMQERGVSRVLSVDLQRAAEMVG